MSEADIQRGIIEALGAIGAFALRVQAGKVQVRRGWMQLAPQGTPDIYVLVPPHGLSVWLEIKSAKGEERESQIAWATQARKRGAVVETVRTVEEALQVYASAVQRSQGKP